MSFRPLCAVAEDVCARVWDAVQRAAFEFRLGGCLSFVRMELLGSPDVGDRISKLFRARRRVCANISVAAFGGIGMWLSLVERCVRDAEVAGSNPVIPTIETKAPVRRGFFIARTIIACPLLRFAVAPWPEIAPPPASPQRLGVCLASASCCLLRYRRRLTSLGARRLAALRLSRGRVHFVRGVNSVSLVLS